MPSIIVLVNEESPAQLDTPAMRQYRQFKEQYSDYLLLFRMGDFYEMFYEDARTASKLLNLTLTARSKGATAVPLAGIPYHALDSYLARLIKAGCRVAICEQVEDPKAAKGIVKRDVTRLVTPGTLTEQELLDQREGNYLAAVFGQKMSGASPEKGQNVGLTWVELSTGAFWTMLLSGEHLLDELTRIMPAEVLAPEGSVWDTPAWKTNLKAACGAVCVSRPVWGYDAHAAMNTLQKHFKTTTLEGFGFDGYDESLSSAAALIEYLNETQKTSLAHILSLRKFDRRDHMAIDGTTLRCLEVHRTLRGNQRSGSLLACIDRTCTGMGARTLERWLAFPLRGYSAIVQRQDAIEELMQDRRRLESIRNILSGVTQVDRVSSAIMLGRVRPRELLALGQTLNALPDLVGLLEGLAGELLCGVRPALEGFEDDARLILDAISEECPNVIRDGGVIAARYDQELDRLRSIGADGQSWLSAYQQRLCRATGIGNLKVGFNKVFGYYIEVTNANADKVPGDFIRKQTVKNAERYITDELKRYESEALTAAERAKALEVQLFEQLRIKLSSGIERLQGAASALALLDVLAALAQLAIERDYRRPVITQDNVLQITAGRHPVLAEQLRQEFVPNDVCMSSTDDRLLIITGPNMAGKSTYIRQTALLVLLAQTGSFIPAQDATIGLVDRIFTRVGAADELSRGLSTFMLEMVETANILNNATSRSLVILDEVGRGTSTCDGLALAWAICEHLALRVRCRALFATHYHELTELEALLDGASNLNVAVREWADEVIFLHKIVPGGADQSYGVHVARLAGVPREVIDRAKSLLPTLQAHVAKGLDMPELARRAKQSAAQMGLFADPTQKIIGELKHLDLENTTGLAALEILRRLKEMI
ncbi:MAG: DNA mismatch repair protein MutS [Planctomycetes bacterium]|jgi:DNA mismatch repair protein MutS|nr:DNA mismatch repair protein MutS [Planctomycetota bacterium]